MSALRNGLYPKLAAQGIRQNRRFFVPYLLALAGLTAAFYVMSALCSDPGVREMRGFDYVMVMMQIGMFVAGVLSAVLLLYINSFLMKQRKKELGLYNILGMGKGNIALIQCWESLYTAILGIGGGLVLGVAFHKLAAVALVRLLQFPIPFHSSLSPAAMARTAAFFGLLLLLALVLNLFRVRLSNPIELLHGGSVGEKEPRTRWLLAVIGAVCLGAGYFIAVTTKDPALAMAFYFLAVILVIIGTYCLFTAGSIALLKLLRKNKGYYYQTGHFIGVSGMLYRMKRNAVGLANICILSTMVMVMISGTLALYLGQGEIIAAQYPASFNITIGFDPSQGQQPNLDGAERLVRSFAADHSVPVSSLRSGRYLQFGGSETREGYPFPDSVPGFLTAASSDNTLNRTFFVLTAADYAGLSGQPAPALASRELAVCGTGPAPGPLTFTSVGGGSLPFAVTQTLPSLPTFSVTTSMSEPVCLVTADETDRAALRTLVGQGFTRYSALVLAELDCSGEEELALMDAWSDRTINDAAFFDGTGDWEYWRTDSRAEMSVDGYAMAGGFLFLGVILGILFLMATVLIIYYKQVSEGYEDQGRFEIMRKVGLSQREVRASIRSQVLLVFCLPIAVAAVHILFDFNLVARMLTMFGVRSVMTVAVCTAGTLLAFLAVYAAVYSLTARTYYKIVR